MINAAALRVDGDIAARAQRIDDDIINRRRCALQGQTGENFVLRHARAHCYPRRVEFNKRDSGIDRRR